MFEAIAQRLADPDVAGAVLDRRPGDPAVQPDVSAHATENDKSTIGALPLHEGSAPSGLFTISLKRCATRGFPARVSDDATFVLGFG